MPVREFSHHDIHQLPIEDVLKRLETSNGGLSFDEAQRRLARYGPNVLVEPDRYSLLRGLVRHFTHFLAILLWIAAGLSFAAELGALVLLLAEEGRKIIANQRKRKIHTHTEATQETNAS